MPHQHLASKFESFPINLHVICMDHGFLSKRVTKVLHTLYLKRNKKSETEFTVSVLIKDPKDTRD